MREPVAIGFYPENRETLIKTVQQFLHSQEKTPVIGAVVPHAGYSFSGSVAGKTFASVELKNRIMIFGPNHSGYGNPAASSSEIWHTPLGNVKADSNGLLVDEIAHRHEHSIEVQLPFLQVLKENFIFTPICLKQIGFSEIEKLSEQIADHNTTFIASSDFIHFGPNYGYTPVSENQISWVKEQDEKMIEKICRLDAHGFYKTAQNYTVCGIVPITLLILVAKKLGATRGKLISYKTSYEVRKDDSFVSYAGIVVF